MDEKDAHKAPHDIANPSQLRASPSGQASGECRLLLVSDTHGSLSFLDALAEREGANAIVHAGDLGFYDDLSPERLSDRELMLRIRHSHLPEEDARQAISAGREAMIAYIREKALLGDMPGILARGTGFRVPVYAVWGNHEDVEVIRRFREGVHCIGNFHLLDERSAHRVGPFLLFGLGGNVLPGAKLFHTSLAGGAGRVWSTLSQFGQLRALVDREARKTDIRILVTHVSPGKEPIVARLAAHLEADYHLSGHMGPPHCLVWQEFAIREPQEATGRLEIDLGELESHWADRRRRALDAETATAFEGGMQMLGRMPDREVRMGRGQSAPAWYRDTIWVNLPDARDGYPTRAERIYKQVNAVLVKGGFKRIGRGVYALKAAVKAGKKEAKAPVAKKAKKTAQKRTFSCPTCKQRFASGVALGAHYKAEPSHRAK